MTPLRQPAGRAGLAAADGQHEQDAKRVQLARQPVEQVARRIVEPVRVLDGEQQRLPVADPLDDEIPQRLDPQPGRELGVARPEAEQRRDEWLAAIGKQLARSVAPGAIGDVASVGPAGAAQHARAALVRGLDERVEQPRLADPRLAGDRQHGSPAGEGLFEQVYAGAQFGARVRPAAGAAAGWPAPVRASARRR